MDRIDFLIKTLVQQFQQKESPAVLLQTVAQLQTALTVAHSGQSLHLGTAKIAVMMPMGNQVVAEPPTINEQIVNTQPVLADTLSKEPIRELKKAIGINDRFLLIQELFEGDEKKFEQAIKALDAFTILAEASFWMDKEIKAKPGYQKDSPAAVLLDQLVSRRFS
ncbi:MAG: hypothetical protein ACKO41_05530 [Sphingomonadales bacterium]